MTDDLDRLIDSAAREMTDAPAPVDLRARVVAEISRQDEAKASFHKWGWLAAAAGIVLVVYLAWPDRQPAFPTPAVAPSAAHTPGGDATGPRSIAPPDPGPVPRTVRLFRRATRPRDEGIPSIPALDAPDALEIAPLVAGTTELPQLTVSSLEVADLDIKPLTPPQ
jgi:hypothetical protein